MPLLETLGAIGGILGGLGTAAGGASSLFGGSDGHQGRQDTKWFYKNRLQMIVKDAKKAGLSPLAALGVSGSMPSAQVGGNSNVSEGLHRMGQGLERALKAGDSREDRAMRQANLRIQNAKADYAESQALAARKALSESGETVSLPEKKVPLGIVGPNQGFKHVEEQIPYSQSMGKSAGTAPLEKWNIDDNGMFWRVPYDTEMLESSWYHQGKYIIGRGSRHIKNLWKVATNLNDPVWIARIKAQAPRVNPPKGMKIVYHPFSDRYQLVDNSYNQGIPVKGKYTIKRKSRFGRASPGEAKYLQGGVEF